VFLKSINLYFSYERSSATQSGRIKFIPNSEILKFTNIKEDEIGIVKGATSLPKIISNKDKYKIVLFSNKTFSSLVDSGNWQKLVDFFDEMQFTLKVNDEIHLQF
jgi:hypothetical protein